MNSSFPGKESQIRLHGDQPVQLKFIINVHFHFKCVRLEIVQDNEGHEDFCE